MAVSIFVLLQEGAARQDSERARLSVYYLERMIAITHEFLACSHKGEASAGGDNH